MNVREREVFTIYRCPECGYWEGYSDLNYAPWCYCRALVDPVDMVPLSVISVEEVASVLREAGIDADVQYPEATE